MTPNGPETLDFALTRAGRIDRKFYVDLCERRRAEKLLRSHFAIPLDERWPEFRSALPCQASIADAQALAVREESMAESLLGGATTNLT